MNNGIIKKLYSMGIKQKIILFYLVCIIIPLFVADEIIAGIIFNAEKKERQGLDEGVASSIAFILESDFGTVDEIAKSVYISSGIYDFLNTRYASEYDYYLAYNNFRKNSTLWDLASLEHCKFNFYADNKTLVGGGGIQNIKVIENTDWYKDFKNSGQSKLLWIGYYKDETSNIEDRKHIYLIQALDYYPRPSKEKILVFELNYDYLVNELMKISGVNEGVGFEVVEGDRIVLSSDLSDTSHEEFRIRTDDKNIDHSIETTIYGCRMKINILKRDNYIKRAVNKYFFIVLVLVAFSFILPLLGMIFIKNIFTNRLIRLSNTVKGYNDEHLELATDTEGSDEISLLARNYNTMARRINYLIDTVYKHQLRESESIMARQKAELLALQSQINPHFLFNALESIRMHSIIKHEQETARMIENLAVIQRQYVEWDSDIVKIKDEMNFVKAYLDIQSYRFGDRLSYSIDIEDEAYGYDIPKLSIVTFVENACIHGVEPKASKCWIFVRSYVKNDSLYIEIEDTGIGMDEEELGQLVDKMNNASIELLKKGTRVGIINACLRLKMYSKDKIKFEVSSEEAVGTIVTIKMKLI
ncbi:two-component system, sensor histidine kinase YesM [Butyrivibrio fibrisolvens DSM 3071]|uniref:Two-component system, sensor histidine kinase YesM n=1 Tax=Butyrivibrio fibrisolvens DSM 3071 TaxID=1121131 RepID=A0A1M5WF92_BUTFI|nr:histidine kinase [Butyrivibrio fibrisolvens]SHH85903.1 two-component system, sensor histidine kinase YesM [Butyrivibrio fibrisolvens DSM 3071]